MNKDKEQPYLIVYNDKSVLFDGKEEYIFEEGKPSPEAVRRLNNIKAEFEKGFLVNLINECKNPDIKVEDLPDEHKILLSSLVDFTSEVGRALVGITILQMCIKCIEPRQSIRLHKAGRGDFSWKDGIPMRVLDKNYITPVLKENDLLRLNADGFMMTRSLAENYPYSKLYKAAMRGARDEWLQVVDLLESGELNPTIALRYMIILLINRSANFTSLANETIELTLKYLLQKPSIQEVTNFIKDYVDNSSYSARVFEIAMHSLYQVLDAHDLLPGKLKRLTQMRSANKKHGNVGDIEVTAFSNEFSIIEAWDAKYGKPYLRDELEELAEKLLHHPETEIAGFVVNETPNLKEEIINRVNEISDMYNTSIKIFTFNEWVENQIERIEFEDNTIVAREWLMAFVESLCQRRREIAPIDEPCDKWVQELNDALNSIK